jgi:hypothetical protein
MEKMVMLRGTAMPLAHLGMGAVVMLGWGLPLTALTLRVLRVSEEEHLVAGSFLAVAYGLLATPILHWLLP